MKNSRAGSPPLFVHSVYDDYPITPDERAVYGHIVRRAGWQGDWCRRSATEITLATMIGSVRTFRYIIRFLLQAGMVEEQPSQGKTSLYRPRLSDAWIDPEQLPALRRAIYPRSSRERSRGFKDETTAEVIQFPIKMSNQTSQSGNSKQPPIPEDKSDAFQHPACVMATELLRQGVRQSYRLGVYAADNIAKRVGDKNLPLWGQIIREFLMRPADKRRVEPNIEILINSYTDRTNNEQIQEVRDDRATRKRGNQSGARQANGSNAAPGRKAGTAGTTNGQSRTETPAARFGRRG
jgi:hypothetical protein